MRFEDILKRFQKKEVTTMEAAELLGLSQRQFLRKRVCYQEEGFDGQFDRRLGKASPKRASDAERKYITKLYEERYKGFTVKHFHEFLRRDHGILRSYTWCKNTLAEEGLITPTKRGGPHRQRRARKPMAGMMIHQDGSTHLWIELLGYNVDLIITMDDATSLITSGFFILQEGTESSLLGIKETIEKYGLFCTFYTDRGTHYFYTEEAGGKVVKGHVTQVGRALKELNIKHIAAYSPQARGRSERMFGTLQNRLPQELALAGIATIEEANAYLQNTYLPRHNAQFAVRPEDPTPAFIKWSGPALDETCCIKAEREVRKDNTVSYETVILQIPPHSMRHHFVGTKVEVRDYLNGSLAIFYGHMRLGRYDRSGQLLLQIQAAAV